MLLHIFNQLHEQFHENDKLAGYDELMQVVVDVECKDCTLGGGRVQNFGLAYSSIFSSKGSLAQK